MTPTLVLMAGLPGAGKSTLALALGKALGWPVLDKDTAKTSLLEAGAPESVAGPASYLVPLALCRDLLAQGLSVIFDSPTGYPDNIRQAEQMTEASGAWLKIIYCHADRKLRNKRLCERPVRLSQMGYDPSTDAQNTDRFAHLPEARLTLDMAQPLPSLMAEALAYISAAAVPKHIVAVGGLVKDARLRVLMVRSPRGDWEFPGGQVEEGEDLITALQREVREETGITVTVGCLAGVYSNVKSRIVMLDFLCDYVSGETTTSAESLEVDWVEPDEALTRIIRPVIRDRMRDMLEFDGEVVYRAYEFDADKVYAEYVVHEERVI